MKRISLKKSRELGKKITKLNKKRFKMKGGFTGEIKTVVGLIEEISGLENQIRERTKKEKVVHVSKNRVEKIKARQENALKIISRELSHLYGLYDKGKIREDFLLDTTEYLGGLRQQVVKAWDSLEKMRVKKGEKQGKGTAFLFLR